MASAVAVFLSAPKRAALGNARPFSRDGPDTRTTRQSKATESSIDLPIAVNQLGKLEAFFVICCGEWATRVFVVQAITIMPPQAAA
jgi:hypothetical protein